jgi:hypothetical protein
MRQWMHNRRTLIAARMIRDGYTEVPTFKIRILWITGFYTSAVAFGVAIGAALGLWPSPMPWLVALLVSGMFALTPTKTPDKTPYRWTCQHCHNFEIRSGDPEWLEQTANSHVQSSHAPNGLEKL